MANRRISGTTYKGAIIDTVPGAGGYYTSSVKPSDHKVEAIFLQLSGIWAGTVTLQFRDVLGTWTNYDEYTEADLPHQRVDDFTNTEWRAGVGNGNLTSGTVRIVLKYHNGEYV